MSETSFDKIMYAFNVFIMYSLLVILIVFAGSNLYEDQLKGLLLLVPLLVANSMASMSPDEFYYMWNGSYDMIKILSIFVYIPAFLLLFNLKEGQKIEMYSLVIISLMLIYLFPQMIMPNIMDLIDYIWERLSSVLNISPRPNYIWRDIVFPSICTGGALIVSGVSVKAILQ